MDQPWIEPSLWVVLVVVSLVALATGVGLVVKAFSFQSQYLLGGSVGILGTLCFTALGLLVPLVVLSGKTYQQSHLLVDLMMLGVSGLVVLGVVFFIVDHLQERPNFLILAASASLAIGIFPWLYVVSSVKLNEQFQIAVVGPESVSPAGLDPLKGERGVLESSQKVVPATEPSGQVEPVDAVPTVPFNPLDLPSEPIPQLSAVETQSVEIDSTPKSSGKDWLYDEP